MAHVKVLALDAVVLSCCMLEGFVLQLDNGAPQGCHRDKRALQAFGDVVCSFGVLAARMTVSSSACLVQYQAAGAQWGHFEQQMLPQQHYMPPAAQQQPDYMAYYHQQPQASLGPAMAQQASLTVFLHPEQ